jgi:hypothetical protein
MKMEQIESRGGWVATLVLYVAWAITAIGTILDALYVREAVMAIASRIQMAQDLAYHNRGGVGIDLTMGFAMTAFDEILIIILGCVAVAVVVSIEYYYRKGRPKGLLYKRIGIVVGIEVAVIVVGIIIRALALL